MPLRHWSKCSGNSLNWGALNYLLRTYHAHRHTHYLQHNLMYHCSLSPARMLFNKDAVLDIRVALPNRFKYLVRKWSLRYGFFYFLFNPNKNKELGKTSVQNEGCRWLSWLYEKAWDNCHILPWSSLSAGLQS